MKSPQYYYNVIPINISQLYNWLISDAIGIMIELLDQIEAIKVYVLGKPGPRQHELKRAIDTVHSRIEISWRGANCGYLK